MLDVISSFSLLCSKIAKLSSFSCDRFKCGYVANFGLAPFIKLLLAEALIDTLHVRCFDESYKERTDGHASTILGQYC